MDARPLNAPRSRPRRAALVLAGLAALWAGSVVAKPGAPDSTLATLAMTPPSDPGTAAAAPLAGEYWFVAFDPGRAYDNGPAAALRVPGELSGLMVTSRWGTISFGADGIWRIPTGAKADDPGTPGAGFARVALAADTGGAPPDPIDAARPEASGAWVRNGHAFVLLLAGIPWFEGAVGSGGTVLVGNGFSRGRTSVFYAVRKEAGHPRAPAGVAPRLAVGLNVEVSHRKGAEASTIRFMPSLSVVDAGRRAGLQWLNVFGIESRCEAGARHDWRPVRSRERIRPLLAGLATSESGRQGKWPGSYFMATSSGYTLLAGGSLCSDASGGTVPGVHVALEVDPEPKPNAPAGRWVFAINEGWAGRDLAGDDPDEDGQATWPGYYGVSQVVLEIGPDGAISGRGRFKRSGGSRMNEDAEISAHLRGPVRECVGPGLRLDDPKCRGGVRIPVFIVEETEPSIRLKLALDRTGNVLALWAPLDGDDHPVDATDDCSHTGQCGDPQSGYMVGIGVRTD